MTTAVDQEIQASRLDVLLPRINKLSVTRHFDAYGDIDWDAPEMAIDRHDPRWELPAEDPLGRTAWYQALPQEQRAEIGLHRIATMMKVGWQFESVLKRGLLEYASRLADGDPQFRYAYHEVIEEAQHSLMFAEFVNRSGLKVAGLPWPARFAAARVVLLARWFPELFFFFVLGGEDPIDHVQRRLLREGRDLHPLVERIVRIHVTEEARHLSFARALLRERVPQLGWFKRHTLAVGAPLILGAMAALMLLPSRRLIRRHHVPVEVLRDAYANGDAMSTASGAIAKPKELLAELGLDTAAARAVWRVLPLG